MERVKIYLIGKVAVIIGGIAVLEKKVKLVTFLTSL